MSSKQPYKAFGDRIKFLREQWQQSTKDVSATLEIEENVLRSIESGKSLPEPEILDMLINHFLLTEDQANDLRELAHPSSVKDIEAGINMNFEDMLSKQVVIMPIDNKIIYTDSMHANVNDNGVILQFMQHVPSQQQPAVVGRVGMSREHAERIIKVLRHTLDQYDRNHKPKSLPRPDSDKKQK